MPEEYKLAGAPEQERFMFYDNNSADNRIMLFGTDEGLLRLARSPILLMDGNFKMAPTQFKHVYVIRAPFKDGSVTCVYALLQNKRKATYVEMFDAVITKLEDLGLSHSIRPSSQTLKIQLFVQYRVLLVLVSAKAVFSI